MDEIADIEVGFGRTEHRKLDVFSVSSDPACPMAHDEEKLAWRLLVALLEMGRADIAPAPPALAAWLDVPETRVQEVLVRLDAQGLVDEARCRLSMRGLVLAVTMDGAQKLCRQPAAA